MSRAGQEAVSQYRYPQLRALGILLTVPVHLAVTLHCGPPIVYFSKPVRQPQFPNWRCPYLFGAISREYV